MPGRTEEGEQPLEMRNKWVKDLAYLFILTLDSRIFDPMTVYPRRLQREGN